METQTQTQSVTQPNSKYYAIHLPEEFRGVYRAWDEVKKRIDTVTFNRNKSFFNQEEADYWAEHGKVRPIPEGQQSLKPLVQPILPRTQPTPVRPVTVRPVAQVEDPKSPLQSLPQPQSIRPQPSVPGLPTFPAKRDLADVIQPDERKSINTNNAINQDEGVKFADLENVLCITSWYAVARGRRPGLYSDWDGPGGAQEQVDGFKGAIHKKVPGRTAAVDYLRSYNVPDHKIRLFARTCRTAPGSTLRATFNDEWKRYAATQTNWSPHESRKEKIDAINAEIIRHYLPGGILDDQIVDGEIVLTDGQTLTIYREMLRAAKKEPGESIYDCLHNFKAVPYVNIIDFIDDRRHNEQIKTFAKWEEFKSHSLDPGHKIDSMFAKENELLAPLLHNLPKGPEFGNPISVRKRFEKKRALKNRTAEDKTVTEQALEIEPQEVNVVSAPVREADIGYSAMLARWTPPSPPPFTSPVSMRGPMTPATDRLVSRAQEEHRTAFDAPETWPHIGSPLTVRTPTSNSPTLQPRTMDDPVINPPPIADVPIIELLPSLDAPVAESPLIGPKIQNLVPSSIPASTSDYGEVLEISQVEVVAQSTLTDETSKHLHTELRIPSSAPASPSILIRQPSMERSDELDLVQDDTIPQTPPPAEIQSSLPMRSSVRRRLLMVRIPAKQQSTSPCRLLSKLNKRGMDEVEIEAERPKKRGRPPKAKVDND